MEVIIGRDLDYFQEKLDAEKNLQKRKKHVRSDMRILRGNVTGAKLKKLEGQPNRPHYKEAIGLRVLAEQGKL